MTEPAAALRDAAPPMRFVDFALRAWREGPYMQVIAHATPVGGMRQPVAVRLGPFSAEDYRLRIDASLAECADLGRRLARLLLPEEVWQRLSESLVAIAPQASLGLRVRLCLDDDLIDLPWEYLYRPDVEAEAAQSGFLLMDGRVSLVREPASLVAVAAPGERRQRGLFVGTFFDDGSDTWSVGVEHRSLSKAMRPLRGLLGFDFVRADAGDEIMRALAEGCDLFHYAGHTEVENGRGAMVQLAHAAAIEAVVDADQAASQDATPVLLESLPGRAPWAWSDTLAFHLARGGTRLAVFNACNSGYWPFVRPFMRAGVPAVIGVQGLVSNIAALNFAEKLYQSLAVGLSLDEAMTYARLYVTDPHRSYYAGDWGRFMAYMPTDAAVLFPRPERGSIRRRQSKYRAERERTVGEVREQAQRIDGAGVSRMLSDIAERSVLILGRFTDKRKAILDAIRRALATPPHQYVPLLFDFDKPGDRDLIESIVRFASVSRFVIADLSDPKSVPAELQAIVPNFPSLPVVPIIEASQREYPVADHILRRASVRTVVPYRDEAHLLSLLDEQVIAPAEALYATLKPPVPG
ncbi:MAG TPA: CHAT domain-containing protein [Rhodocyclaceae bacterium]|nr:CHAT domain-containing protein [Rhodocyclaceae bacterium]